MTMGVAHVDSSDLIIGPAEERIPVLNLCYYSYIPENLRWYNSVLSQEQCSSELIGSSLKKFHITSKCQKPWTKNNHCVVLWRTFYTKIKPWSAKVLKLNEIIAMDPNMTLLVTT